MYRGKRMFDLIIGASLAVLFAPVLLLLLGIVLIREGRPLLHASERMQGPDRAFRMWKIRTMAPVAQADEVTGGHSVGRITTTGRWLRKWRLDELPQLWNVLRGEMSLVAPSPPIRRYVQRYPALYAQVLRTPPGLTGLGALRFIQHEQRLLRRCGTAAQTDDVYARFCLHRKARVDLVYLRHRSVRLDLLVLWHTAHAFLRGFRHEALLPLRRNRVSFATWIRHCFHLATGSARALWRNG